MTLGTAYAGCERIARRSAANFYPGFLLLPRAQRRGMYALYAFNRLTDDISDEPGPSEWKRAALDRWEGRLDEALSGKPRHPVLAALADTVRRFGVPHQYLFDVVAGCRLDLDPRPFPRFEDLYEYCRLVASAVGLACIHVWGFRGADAPRYAEAAGVALQLTNILRDLGEDQARGRVYLPQEDLQRFDWNGTDGSAGFRELMHFQAVRATRYYEIAAGLEPCLQPPGRAVYRVLLGTYRALLYRIEAAQFDVFARRVRVPPPTKLRLVLSAIPVRLGWAGA